VILPTEIATDQRLGGVVDVSAVVGDTAVAGGCRSIGDTLG